MSAYVMLIAILVIGYVSKNMTVAYASGILIILKAALPARALEYVNAHGVNWGIIVLTVGMFAPIALGNIEPRQLVESFKTPAGILGIFVGLAVAVIGAWGVDSLHNDPTLVVSLMVGTIIGVAFFKGLPMGPVIASGMVYGILRLAHFIFGI